jgi:hypothetical protein
VNLAQARTFHPLTRGAGASRRRTLHSESPATVPVTSPPASRPVRLRPVRPGVLVHPPSRRHSSRSLRVNTSLRGPAASSVRARPAAGIMMPVPGSDPDSEAPGPQRCRRRPRVTQGHPDDPPARRPGHAGGIQAWPLRVKQPDRAVKLTSRLDDDHLRLPGSRSRSRSLAEKSRGTKWAAAESPPRELRWLRVALPTAVYSDVL